MTKRSLIFCLVAMLFLGPVAAFAMTSSNYRIDWDNFNAGGDDVSSSTNYGLIDTIGDTAPGTSTSANYRLSAGYRAVDDQAALRFISLTQANGTQTAYTAFNNGANTVTVTSVASFSSGDHIVVVENKGFAQKIAIGKITNVAGLVLTVDVFSGDNLTMSPAVSGGDDFVYKLSGNFADFGTVTYGTENTAVTMNSVLTTGSSGYTLYANTNHDLQTTGAQTIANLADSAVSLGSEEYGVSTTGTSALNVGYDFAVTTTQQAIMSRGGATPNNPDRLGVIYKLSVTPLTQAGTYSQDVTYTLTVNY
jgi:hypothetical protein